MTVQTIISGSGEPLIAVTRYCGLQSSQQTWTSQQFRNQVIPAAGTLKNLYVKITNAPGTGDSRTFTVMKNGTATSLTVTISGSSQTEASDTSNTVSVVAGDYVSLRQTVAGGVLTAAEGEWTVQFDGTTAKDSIILGCSTDDAPNAGVTEYNSLSSGEGWDTTENNRAQLITTAGTISNLYIKLENAPGSGDGRTFTLMKNGAPTSMAIALTDSTTSGNTSANSFAVSAGDRLSLRAIATGTPTNSTVGWGVRHVTTTDEEAPVMGSTDKSVSTSASRYIALASSSAAAEATESNVMCLTQRLDIQDLYVRISNDPGGGSRGYSFTLMKNGVATPLTLTISGIASTGNNTTDIVRPDDNDDFSLRVSPQNSPDTLSWIQWGFNSVEVPPPQNYTKTLTESLTLTETSIRSIKKLSSETLNVSDTTPKKITLSTTRTVILRPISDRFVNDWNFSTGSTAWDLLDEELPDDDSTYVYSQTDNATCRVNVETNQIPAGAIINKVTIYYRAKKNNVGADVTADVFIWEYSGGGSGVGATGRTLATNYWTQNWSPGQSPDGDAWTVDEVNNLAAEVKRNAPVSSSEMRITQIWLEVEYQDDNTYTLTDTLTKKTKKRIPDTINLSDGDSKKVFKKLTQGLNTADSFSRIWDLSREYSDSLSLADSKTLKPGKLQSETMTLTDPVITKNIKKKLLDSSGLTDIFSRSWTLAREYSDTIFLADSVLKKPSISFSENLDVSDLGMEFVFGRTLSESLSLTDSIPKKTSKPLSDTINLNDGDTKKVGKLLVETLIPADSITFSIGRELTDSITLTDTETMKQVKILSDNLNLSDTFSRDVSWFKNPTEIAALTDSQTKKTSKEFSDSLSINDVKPLFKSFKRIAETLNLSDGDTKKVFSVLTESLTASDSIKKAISVTKTDILSLTDSIITQIVKILALTESLTLADSLTKKSGKLQSGIISLTDSKSFTVAKKISDALNLSDGDTRKILRSLVEGINIDDSRQMSIATELADTLSLNDVLSKKVGRTLTDVLALADATIGKRIFKALVENITLLDDISTLDVLIILESLGLLDTVSLTLNTSGRVRRSTMPHGGALFKIRRRRGF